MASARHRTQACRTIYGYVYCISLSDALPRGVAVEPVLGVFESMVKGPPSSVKRPAQHRSIVPTRSCCVEGLETCQSPCSSVSKSQAGDDRAGWPPKPHGARTKGTLARALAGYAQRLCRPKAKPITETAYPHALNQGSPATVLDVCALLSLDRFRGYFVASWR